MKKMMVAAAVVVAVLAGCSQTAPESTVDLPDETAFQSAEPEEEQGTDWEAVQAFMDQGNGGGRPSYVGLVAPGSPADRWSMFALDMYEARVASGDNAYAVEETYSYQIDKEAGVLTETTSFADGSPAVVMKLTDWVTDDEGRVVSYSDENGVSIAERLWTQEPSGSANGESVQLLSAFRTSSGFLVVNVAVTTDQQFLDYEPSYVGPDGIARKPYQPNMVEAVPGATNLVTYWYEAAPFGGTFTYTSEVADDSWVTTPISLTVS